MAAGSAELVVNIVTKLSGDGMKQAEQSTSKFKSGLATASKVATGALIGIGAAAVGAAKAAAEDAQSQAVLANSMKNAAGASKDQIAATEDWITAQSKATGVADDELRPALGTLVRATGDVTKSQAALKTAMDISAATGKPLSSVSQAMAKGFAGNTGALSRLVPGISKAAIESGNFGRVLKEVKDKTQGAATAAADTAAGKFKRFQTSLQETKESAGAVLLPALETLMGVLMKLGQWAQDHGTMFAIIAGTVATLAAAIVLLNVAVSIYTTITTIAGIVSGAAWAAALGPILLVIAAVALVVVGIVLLWKKSETFRAIVMAVWNAIKKGALGLVKVLSAMWNGVTAGAKRMGNIVKAVWNAVKNAVKNVVSWMRDAWRNVIQAIVGWVRGYLQVWRNVISGIRTVVANVVGWIRDRWRGMIDSLKSIADGLRDKIKAVWDGIKSAAGAAFDWVKSKWEGVVSTLKSAASGLGSALAKPFDAVKNAIQNVINMVENLIGALGRIHVPKISLPHIPGLSRAAPAPAVDTAGVAAVSAAPTVPSARAGTATMGGGTTINIYGALDPEATARQIERLLSGHTRRTGMGLRTA